MADPLPDPHFLERAAALRKKRSAILALPPEQALDRILSDPQPAALVHSFPETDFYLLVHDIGPEDALPLLALASSKQWDHLLDLESWGRDRIEMSRLTRWMNLLMEADPQRFIRWFLKDRLAFGELYLFHHVEVRIREHDQDPSEFGEGFFTLDQVYYVRLLKMPPPAEGSAIGEEERQAFLMKLLQRLAEHDHPLFQSLLLEAAHVIPAEAEEAELRWRNVRLAEKGFAPFDEAVGIYQPMTVRRLESQPPKCIAGDRSGPAATLLPVPAYPLRELKADTHFSRALARIQPDEALSHLQWEFANLCNRIIVADHKIVRDREQLAAVVAKACGYVSMGLERLKGPAAAAPDPVRAAAALMRHPLVQLFRLGFGRALEVKWQAERWLGTCWFAQAGLKLGFWGEHWMGVLGGVLLKKPQYYDNGQTGVLYREFAALADVERTERVLKQVQAVDHLLAVMDPRLDPPARYSFLTWKNLLLTQWARHRLDLKEDKVRPLALADFGPFFDELLPPLSPEGAGPRRIPDALKTDFVAWLTRETGLKDFEISAKLGIVFEDLFAEVEAEYGRVATRDLDPRFVQLFLLRAA